MNENIYKRICSIYDFDDASQMLTYRYKILSDDLQETNIYKSLLFEFCFLVNRGSVKFKDLNDIWFFKSFTTEEKNLAIKIIDVLLKNIEDKKIDASEYMNFCGILLNIDNIRKFNIFKYLQSIYSYYKDDLRYIIYPIIYTLGFDSKALKLYLKNDLMDVISRYIVESIDNIYYYNIDEKFIHYFNKLLYYLNYNEKNPKEKKDINSLYNYLCDYGKNPKESNDLDEKYPEYINYFSKIKDLICLIEVTYINKDKIVSEKENSFKKINEENIKENNNGQNSNKNGNSTKSSFDINENNSNIIISNGENTLNKELLGNNTNNNSTIIRDIVKEEIKIYLEYLENCNKLKGLCEKIPCVLNNMKIDKNSLDQYYNILLENRENKFLISKLSSTIILLQNSNIINLRRKLTEVIPFHIMEKYQDYFSFTSDYFPNSSNLKELKKIISDKQLEALEAKEKKIIDDDLNRLGDIRKMKNQKNDPDCVVNINDNNQIGKQIKMVIDFLKYYKKNCNPVVHISKKNSDYYLLPRSLFSSNLKYADYIFSLSDNVKQNNYGDQNKDKIKLENESDEYSLYKDEKIITIDEALNILFSKNYLNMSEINVDNKIEGKKKIVNKLKLFDKNIEPFYDIFSLNKIDDFIITDDIKAKESDIINKLNWFDISFSKIINDELSRGECHKIIQDLKELIEIENEDAERIYLESKKLIANTNNEELVQKKINRLNIILNFLGNQREKINNARKNIYEEYENYLNVLVNKAKEYNIYLKKYYSFNKSNYFDEWIKTESAQKAFEKKYLNLPQIMANFKDLLESVKLDIDYSFDEKFVLWAIKNNFSKYMK